ncbi:ureidoglycolate lyase [Tropicimonas sp. IMCC34043]|uniref:ureidoglycolate lyase n=1 Tax=Tropicimonas sp. IMCC34043 TaxID=2248760 RepID=UPI000E280348|nr:ureidoglycolate lyase [Tropicimonas sp. IMCC34043]
MTPRSIPVSQELAALVPLVLPIRTTDGSRVAFAQAVDHSDRADKPVLSVAAARGRSGAAMVSTLERHPHSGQTFLPLAPVRWLIAVAPDDAQGQPDLSRLRAAVAGPGDAVIFPRNVWHAPLTVLDGDAADFVMLMWRLDPAEDTQTFVLPVPVGLGDVAT